MRPVCPGENSNESGEVSPIDNWKLRTPVAFFIFNRPDTTAQVFEEIANARPPKLLIVADGPRANHPGDLERCSAARTVVQQINWDCEVLTDFADENLGCRRRVSSGLSWVFSKVEEAIILEDDCLPHPSFFQYCQELLAKYRNDQQVMMITGTNFKNRQPDENEASYFFSRYFSVWGWASWRRAWSKYDPDMKKWLNDFGSNDLRYAMPDYRIRRYYEAIFSLVAKGFIDTWDYQWSFTCLLHNGLAVTPAANLVENIGFIGAHTHYATRAHQAKRGDMRLPLSHPHTMFPRLDYDEYVSKHIDQITLFKMIAMVIREKIQLRPSLQWTYPLLHRCYRMARDIRRQ